MAPPVTEDRFPGRSAPASPARRWAGRLAASLPAILAVLLAFGLCWPGEEDAYIYFRYALNAAHGLGLVFNPGQRVEGFSSPLWMLLLWLGARAGAAVHLLARGLGVACTAALVLAAGRLAAAVGLDARYRLAVQLSLALDFYVLAWGQSGLETPFYMLVMTLAATAYLRAEYPLATTGPVPGRRRWTAAWLLGVLSLARPEGLALAVLALADRLRRGDRRSAQPYLLGVGAVFVPYLLWRRAYFGAWLPNTSVKLYPLHVDRSVPQAFAYLGYLGVLALILPAVGWSLARWRPAERARIGRLWLAGLVLTFGLHFVAGGDYRPGFRYLLPPLPLLLAAAWATLAAMSRRAAPRLRLAFAGVLLLSLVAPSLVLLHRDPWMRFTPSGVARSWLHPYAHRERWGVAVSWWIVRHVPDGATVAYGQMGKAPYLASLLGRDIRFLDTVGWVDREVAAIHRPDRNLLAVMRSVASGRSPKQALADVRRQNVERFVELVLRRRPDFVLAEPYLMHAGMDALRTAPEFLAGYRRLGAIASEPPVEVFSRVGGPRLLGHPVPRRPVPRKKNGETAGAASPRDGTGPSRVPLLSF